MITPSSSIPHPVSIAVMHAQILSVNRSLIAAYLLDLSNDIYHANNFYCYLLFSAKYRQSLLRLFTGRKYRRPYQNGVTWDGSTVNNLNLNNNTNGFTLTATTTNNCNGRAPCVSTMGQ